MTEQDNIRLAEWAEFRLATKDEISEGCTVGFWWKYPDLVELKTEPPDFPNDIAACYKHFEPKLTAFSIRKEPYSDYNASVRIIDKSAQAHDKEPATAFCEAVLKLIKGE